MSINGRRAGIVAAGIFCSSSRIFAQPGELRPAPRVLGESFVLGRYATGGAASLYVAARVGRASILVGLTGNSQRGSPTSIAGIGTRFRFTAGVSGGVFVAAARTRDDVQLRLYTLPKVTVGRVAISAIGLLSQSTTDDARQISINPLMAGYRVARWLQLGGSLVAERIGQRSSRVAVGPAAHVRAMRAVVSVEALASGTAARPALRLSVAAR